MNKIITDNNITKKPYITAVFKNEDDNTVILVIQEGSGDNLLREDQEEGYVDYVDYTYEISETGTLTHDENGGMLLLKSYVSDLYDKEGLCSPVVLDAVLDLEGFAVPECIYVF